MISEKTWLGVYDNSPNDIRQALQAYLNAIQSMGSGNGIEFSNREFYNGQIKPLRVPKSSERLDPPLIDVMVLGGYGKGDYNPPEARAIVVKYSKL